VREWLLSEGSVRGRDKRNLRFAVLTAGAPRGHAEPGLRDEVIWWQTGDFGQYARFAAAAASRPPPGGAGVRAVIWLIAGQPAQYEQRTLAEQIPWRCARRPQVSVSC
jgi:hypothetical protein